LICLDAKSNQREIGKMDFQRFIVKQEQLSHAYSKALYFKNQGIFYSMIPKNACTSIFSSFLRAEGVNLDWFFSKNRVHNLQGKFWAFQKEEVFSGNVFKVIALRDPFDRFISALTDKIINPKIAQGDYTTFFEKVILKKFSDINLLEIIRVVDQYPAIMLDEHFAPQSDFLFFRHYDLVINLKNVAKEFQVNNVTYKILHENSSGNSYEGVPNDLTMKSLRSLFLQTRKFPAKEFIRQQILTTIKPGGNFSTDIELLQHIE
jgi:hypothetical protein